jgi:hypothetical protein
MIVKQHDPAAKLDEQQIPKGPFHIVNCALNLGGSSDLSVHTRHSAIFTLTPLYCGSWYVPKKSSGEPEYENPKEIGYISTKVYCGSRHRPTLGQAIAISGAAASPNMGYHTSAPVAFLMTLFNARLGAWFPNPSLSDCQKPSPPNSLKYLLYELFGIANEKSEFSAISDGGHFENLAAIELVKRKCKIIIISDGECDPELKFEGLATLIRMCEVDNLVKKIDIDVRAIHPKKAAAKIDADYSIHPNDEFDWSSHRCAIGKIYYAEYDPTKNPDDYGWLIYIKASMNGREDTAVMQYKATHPTFPHETTSDQFYAENQFESYRSLGKDITEKLFGKVFKNGTLIDSITKDKENRPIDNKIIEKDYMLRIAEELYKIFSPTLPNQAQFTRHADRLMAIWKQLSSNPDLKSLDNALRPSNAPDRSVFYLCSEMIQLMENVYLDLNLEDTWKHIDNKGWQKLFKIWAKSPDLGATWKQTKSTYGERFQSFWDRNLSNL